MKKLLSMMLALILCMTGMLSLAEETDSIGVIGGADGPTVIVTGNEFSLPGNFDEAALAAGRKCVANLRVTELSGIRTGDEMIDAALTEMLKVLGVNTSAQGDEQNFALTIADKEVLTLGFASNGDDAYINSNLLGGTVVLRMEDVEPLANRLLDMLVLMEAIDAEMVEELRANIAMLMQTAPAALAAIPSGAELTEADILALDYSAIQQMMNTLVTKVQPMENVIAPRGCDAALTGYTLTLTNEDFVYAMQAACQFLLDNPKLLDLISAETGYFTAARRQNVWDAVKDSGMYASVEVFNEENPTVDELLNELIASIEEEKALEGDCTMQICLDAENLPVYATMQMPIFSETGALYYGGEAEEPVGETINVEMNYNRLTIAEGVSHVVNIIVNEEPVTFDMLVKENAAHIVISAPEEEPVIIDATQDGDAFHLVVTMADAELVVLDASVVDGKLSAVMNINDDEHVYTCTLGGTCLFSETDYDLSGKLVVTDAYTPAEMETPTFNGMTLPGFAAQKPKAETNTFLLEVVTDYSLDGVDYSGSSSMTFGYNDVRIGVTADAYSADPTDSIMSGSVVRPSELDDAAFANWFVGVVNNLNSWLGNLMMGLPESVLSTIISLGMI